ncbi:hypothetical protein DFJ74DRAFT_710151 [Hyaloraphidium curvatum]|nr:hypothetical protein DFJ74DRAFT_710151 [Hyaloraphidium curvatum]
MNLGGAAPPAAGLQCGRAGCSKPAGRRCCLRCGIERYCSAECQRLAYPEHRPVCNVGNTSVAVAVAIPAEGKAAAGDT